VIKISNDHEATNFQSSIICGGGGSGNVDDCCKAETEFTKGLNAACASCIITSLKHWSELLLQQVL